MAKLMRTQLLPATNTLKDESTRSWAEKLTQFLDQVIRKIAAIPFNQSESLTVADTGNADTEFTVSHNLGRTPNGYILTETDKAACLYNGATAWTDTALYLKCNVANAAITITIF